MIAKADVRPVVDTLFRQKRRGWRGLGGSGNPRETWEDVRSLLSMALLLDTDSVFTLVYWACSELGAAAARARTTVTDMRTACAELSDLAQEGLGHTRELDAAGTALGRALFHNQRTGAGSARRNATLAREGLDAFAARLVPYVDPSGSGTDRRAPAEARAALRTGLPTLLEHLEHVSDLADNVRTVLDALGGVASQSLVNQVLRAIKGNVDALRHALASESAVPMGARTSLIRLASDSVLLATLLAECAPTLVRGTFPGTVAGGSGTGAVVAGTVSAPYELLDGVSDRLGLDVDMGGLVGFDVPSRPNALQLLWPLTQALGFPYVVPPPGVPGPGPWTFRILVDGREGAAITIAAGNYTAFQIVNNVILATLGAVPEDPGGSLFLLVQVHNPGPGTETVELTYQVGVPTPPNTGLGCYIEVTGDIEVMNAFGFPGADADDATQKTARTYWTPVTQLAVVEGLSHQLYGADELGERVRFTPVTSVVTSGCRGITDPVLLSFALTNYLGNGVWNPVLGELTLSGDDLARVRPGDRVVINGVPANTFTVSSVVQDGARMVLASGTAPPDGTYVVTVAPPAGAVVAGMVLEYVDRGITVHGRISLVLYDAFGRLLVTLDRRSSTLPYAPSGTIRYRVLDDRLSLTSTDNSPAGALEVVAVAANAAPALGLAVGPTLSTVDQLLVTGDLAQVRERDYVYDSTGLLGEVDAVLTPTRLRLDVQVPGTYLDTIEVRNRRYQLYNTLLPSLDVSALWTPSQLRALVARCVRAPNAVEAGNDLSAVLGTLDTGLQALAGAVGAYRTAFGALSPYMLDCRAALEETGADRALQLLVSGDLAALLGASADDATYVRRLLRQTRAVSRGLLGTSVYAPAAMLETDAMAVEPSPSLGTAVPAQQSFGGPRSTKR